MGRIEIYCIVVESNVVKVEPEGKPEKASGHGSTRSNCSNRWLDQIVVDPKCEAIEDWTNSTVWLVPVLTTLVES